MNAHDRPADGGRLVILVRQVCDDDGRLAAARAQVDRDVAAGAPMAIRAIVTNWFR